MTRRIIFLRMHERAPWESRYVYNRDFQYKISISENFLNLNCDQILVRPMDQILT
jgi:hypothetical protein